jgi:hypothetical protein
MEALTTFGQRGCRLKIMDASNFILTGEADTDVQRVVLVGLYRFDPPPASAASTLVEELEGLVRRQTQSSGRE